MRDRGGVAAILVALLMFGWFSSGADAQGTKGPNVIIRLRLAGDSPVLSSVRSCLADKLSQMPDVKVASAPTEGVRFIVDIVARKGTDENVLASLVVAETFPMEQFRPRIKEGEDADALLKSIRYYTLLRLHETVPARSSEDLCLTILMTLAIRCCQGNTPSVMIDAVAQFQTGRSVSNAGGRKHRRLDRMKKEKVWWR
jgi:hypothetical protein